MSDERIGSVFDRPLPDCSPSYALSSVLDKTLFCAAIVWQNHGRSTVLPLFRSTGSTVGSRCSMNVAIIAAAGTGTRMAGKRPKQFLELAGIPIIFHTLKAFERCEAIQEIVVVLSAEEVPGFSGAR